MQTTQQPSALAQIIDKLHDKSEVELKRLYIQLSANDMIEEWKKITKEANFQNATEEDIIKVIQSKHYRKNVKNHC